MLRVLYLFHGRRQGHSSFYLDRELNPCETTARRLETTEPSVPIIIPTRMYSWYITNIIQEETFECSHNVYPQLVWYVLICSYSTGDIV